MKKVKILLIALSLVLGGVFFGNIYAAEADTRSLKASTTRPFQDPNYTNPKYQYSVPGGATDLYYTIVKIYDIDDVDAEQKLAYKKALYCLRGGVGFGAHGEDISDDEVEYQVIGEMHKDAQTIISKLNEYLTVQGGIDRDVKITDPGTEDEKTVNLYNAILWIIDEAYLPVDKIVDGEKVYNAVEYKEELLDKAGIPTSQQAGITDNDIEVIQQLAMWYFTNYDEQETGIIPTVSQVLTRLPADYLSINENDNVYIENDERGNNLNRLYQYFINGAIENSNTYKGNDSREKNIEKNIFNSENALTITSNDNEGICGYYEIGPVKFVGDASDRKTVNTSDIVLYDANGKEIAKELGICVTDEYPDANGDTIFEEKVEKRSVYRFLNKDGKEETDLLKGEDYKILVDKVFAEQSNIPLENEDEVYDMSNFKIEVRTTHVSSTATFLSAGNASQPVVEIDKEKVSNDDEITTDVFDLALRKYIVAVDDRILELEEETTRVPDVITTPLTSNKTTADYNHRKDPVEVENGNIVTYRFSVYNEGNVDGYVYFIIDYLPAGLIFDAEANSNFIEFKDTYTADELTGKEYTYEIEGNKIIIRRLNEEILFELKAFDGEKLESESIDVKFKVQAQQTNNTQVLTNIATMTYGAKGINIPDRDSNFGDFDPEELLEDSEEYKGNDRLNKDDLTDKDYHYKGQQDDDDFEKIVIKGKEFDLSLRKFITSIKRDGEEILDPDKRTPIIDTTTLIDGTTATYKHSKEPLLVKQGDIITYTLRAYNEGDLAGYATEITDYIPEGLALILDYDTNFDNGWGIEEDLDYSHFIDLVGENGFYKTEEDVKNLKLEDFENTASLSEVKLVTGKAKITTNLLDEELLKPFDKTLTEETAGDGWQKAQTGEGGLYYKDIQVSCLVIAENTCPDVLTNIAEITAAEDSEENEIINKGDDRDSEPDNVFDDEEYTPGTEIDGYFPGEQDDDDYEQVELRYFDLRLRKFITGVETTNGEVKEITSRIPSLSINEENEDSNPIIYTHPKKEAPVEVANNDIVIYTLRVYNEGTIAGYAEELTDDIPEGLIFLPEHDINKQYEWKMYNKDGELTDSLEEVNTIKTEYLSEKNNSENRNNLINPFDISKEISTEESFNPDYRDVKVAFRVMEPNTSDRIIVNNAQISEDSDDDEDSTPDEWIDKDDDQDNEYIKVKYFDLSLLKWVTQTIVTVDGTTTTTETGFKPNTGLTEDTTIRDNEENEPVAKVEIDKKKLNKTTVKFAYKIRVTNEGEIAGYATEITDFIPEGLEFKAEDNKKFGWVKVGEDKVTTRALETVLLAPDESAELEIVFTWINDKDNFGEKRNVAMISEDYSENNDNSQDIDSDPEYIDMDNYTKEQEDDDDFALVVLATKTGKGASYTLLITVVISMLAAGIYLIKRYVLTY